MKLICSFILIFSFVKSYAVNSDHKHDNKHSLVITISITTVNPTCQKDNGKILIQASGGVAPYEYVISGPYSPQPIGAFFNLPPNTYTVTVTDAIFQTASQSVTLTNSFSEPVVSVASITRPTTCTSHDAILTLNASGGLAPYTYSLDNMVYQSNNSFSNLTAGGYNYVIKDANGCTSKLDYIINNIKISENCGITVSGELANIGCNPFIISLALNGVSGGTPPYTYSLDGINYQNSNQFNNLTDGLNTFWIKDANSSILIYSRSFFDNCYPAFVITTTVQPAICGQNASIHVVGSEGAAPYQYSLDGISYQSSNQFTGLAPGNYIVHVKDAYELEATKFVLVSNNCVSVSATITHATCGNSNGRIQAHAINGTPPYQYSIDGLNYSSNSIFTNLAPNNYILYVKDVASGIATFNAIVNNTPGPQITSINTAPSGCDNQSGTINASIINGTGPFQYSINGTIFQNTPLFSGVAPGNYILTVKDVNNCLDTKPAVVAPSTIFPIVNLGHDTTLCEGQTLLLDATNSNATYLWQDGNTQSTYLITQKGIYNVKVDIAGCVNKDTILVDYLLKPKFTLGKDKFLCQGNSLILKPTFINNVQLQGLTYLWQDSSRNSTFIANQNGLYKLEISNICGFNEDEINITRGVCDLYIPNAFTPNGSNRIFKAGFGDNVVEFQMQIFNRYGQLVFKTSDKNKGWDGNVNGQQQQAGTYAWSIRYRIATSSMWQDMQGTVILLR